MARRTIVYHTIFEKPCDFRMGATPQVYTRIRISAARWLSKAAFLTYIFCVSVVAQTPKLSFTHLSVADGVSQSDVRAIAQDHKGFMWFGTWLGGLNRFDGYTFKAYKHDDQDDRSLGSDTIRTLYVDRAGVLWIGVNEGVDRYDRDTDSFIHYRHRADDPTSRPHYRIASFYEDESGTFWAASFGGLGRFDRTSGRFFSYRPNPNNPPGFGDTDLRSLCLDATTGLLWASVWGEGVSALDRSTGHFTRYKNIPNDPTSLSNNDVVHIFQDRKGNLWFSTLRGLNRFDPRTRTFIRYLHDPRNPASLSDDSLATTYEDRAGRFWVATNNGLNLMDRARGTFTRYLHDPNDSSSLSSNVINPRALYEDASGGLWIGMRSTGVDRLAGVAERFTTYHHNSQDANSPSNNAITGLSIGSAGVLWIGTEAGLDRFDGKTFTHYLADPNDPSRLSPGPERCVARDSHGAVWTGTYGGGLDRLDGQRVKHFRHDPRNSDSPANDNIGGLVPDAEGGLWIGVHGKGMDYFDGRHFTHFPPNPADPTGLPDAFVRPLLLDRHGMLWDCSDNSGLVRFDTHTRKFTAYLMDPNQPGSQGANWTGDVYSDGSSVWVGSPKGLFHFDPQTGKFTRHYTEKDGLATNSVVAVEGDAQGNIWVSTIKGLSRFDPRTETFRNYDVFDGLQGNNFFPRCSARTSDGRLFFGGVNGLSAFYPDKLADNPTPPPVVLTDFELFNKPVKIGGKDSPLRQAIDVASSITLRYDQSVFRFQFAALNYTAPQKNRYAYKLENFDEDWQYTDATRRFATYTHLDHGDYTFRVKASNNDGVWNEQGVALRLTIVPPWWKTSWFRAVGLAVLLAVIWLAYRLRIREVEEREKKFREAVESMPALAFVASPENERIFVNKRWVEYTGLTVEQARGSGWQAAVHPDDLKRVLDKWRTAVATGEPLDYEVRLRHAVEGEHRWFHTRVVPLEDKRRRIVKWCGVATDIEDRKRAEQLQADLAHTSRVSMLGELLASISHELKQPITGTMANARAGMRWLKREQPDLEEVRRVMERIERDGARATAIIERLRALYKKTPPKRELVDVIEIISEMAIMLRGQATTNGVSIRFELAADLPKITADRVQIQQVLMNLMLNGIEAMKDTGGVLAVKARLEDGQVLISISDTGVGLPAERADKVFDAFFTTKPQGSGMGLAIGRSIVESHGGRIWATPNDERGAIFHFSLPTANAAEGRAAGV